MHSDLTHWAGRRVLLTGHTGFKGAWLALWLHDLGARVSGLSLDPPTSPSLFEQAGIGALIDDRRGDIRDRALVEKTVREVDPEIILHLAAQPLVRLSYEEPVETFDTNIMGTVHVLEAARRCPSVRALVCVTTDKCYENKEWEWPYRENDPMGGHDPYSSSKGAAELVIAAYRSSYFSQGTGCATASVRAGNVIGGGDWAKDRLIPDLVRAMLDERRPLIRSPRAVRPWQHVLEALSGYLLIAERLLAGERSFATAFNFGPRMEDAQPVEWIVERMLERWGRSGWDRFTGEQPHEATLLNLDTSRARASLGWQPALSLATALDWIVDWHQAVARGDDPREKTLQQIREYQVRAFGDRQEDIS